MRGTTSRLSATSLAIGFVLLSNAATPAAHSSVGVPGDLLAPEGRTRWNVEAPFRSTQLAPLELPAATARLLRPGERFTFDAPDPAGAGVVHVALEGRGLGWVHLPGGLAECVLQRVTIWRYGDAGRLTPDRSGFRLLNRAATPLAEIWWNGDRFAAGALLGFWRSDAQIEDHTATKIYVADLDEPVRTEIFYGWNTGANTPISSLTPQGYSTVGALVAANLWDFSNNDSGVEIASTAVDVSSAETCNSSRCGYSPAAGKVLNREDISFDNSANLRKDNGVEQRENRANDVVIWLRAGAQNEGKEGAFPDGESRFCFTSDGTGTRTPVPQYVFSHLGAGGYYFQPGDHWEAGPFACEQTVFNQHCGIPNLFDKLWVQACGTHTGKQYADVLKTGVLVAPSGHTFNTVLLRVVADYCVYMASGCGSLWKVDEVRTVNHIWQTPFFGTVARLRSAQNVSDLTSYTTVADTDFKFALFPPLSLQVNAVTGTTVTISWDPGRDVRRHADYKVYWDTDSGGSSGYAFNSDANSGQVSFGANSATISGLTAGQTYYFTVTTRSTFTDPTSEAVTTYESLKYPSQVFGDPDKAYPLEVVATTEACVPAAEVTNLQVAKVQGGQVQFCWDEVVDSCLDGYRLLGSNDAASVAGWTEIAATGAGVRCWTGSPGQRYYIVVAHGPGGAGPWGHYDR